MLSAGDGGMSCGAMAAFAALPDEVPPEGLDLWAAYRDRRVYLYTVLALGLVGDMGRFTLNFADKFGTTSDPLKFYLWDTIAIALFAILAWSKDWRVHGVLLLALFGYAYVGFITWTIQ